MDEQMGYVIEQVRFFVKYVQFEIQGYVQKTAGEVQQFFVSDAKQSSRSGFAGTNGHVMNNAMPVNNANGETCDKKKTKTTKTTPSIVFNFSKESKPVFHFYKDGNADW